MKIVIIGGHLSPALSFIESLPKDVEVFFIGRKHALEGDKSLSLEYTTISKLNIPFFSINAARLQRKLTKHTFSSLLRAPYGFVQSLGLLKTINPDVMVGFGGYTFLSVGLAAYFLKIPIVLHEQTLSAGLTNKIIGRFADKICISWESSRRFFPKAKTVLTGNPIRQAVLQNLSKKKEETKEKPLIYITGGSLGSHVINMIVDQIIDKLVIKYRVLHQTGDAKKHNDFDLLDKHKKNLPQNLGNYYELIKFLSPEQAGQALYNADLVISRSGINTVTELLLFNKPCILVPLPFSGRNEQVQNALMLKNAGIARIIIQKDLTAGKLLQAISEMFDKLKDYASDGKMAKELLLKNPAGMLVEVVLDVAAQKKKT